MDPASTRLPSLPDASGGQMARDDGKAVTSGHMNGLPVSQGPTDLARSSAIPAASQPVVPGNALADMSVSIVTPSTLAATDPQVPAQAAAQEPLETKSKGPSTDPRVAKAMAAALTVRVPEQSRPGSEVFPVRNYDETADISYVAPFGPIAQMLKSDRGAYLLSAAVISPPEERVQLCFQTFDAAMAEQPDAPIAVVKELLAQLRTAESESQELEQVRSKEGQRGITLLRTALHCRAGKQLGIQSRQEAHDKTREMMGNKAPPAWFGKKVYAVAEEGFRYAIGDYLTVFKLAGNDAATRVANLLAVAMNQHDSPRAAWTAVIEQIQLFDEKGPEFKASLMQEVIATLKSAGEAPSSDMK